MQALNTSSLALAGLLTTLGCGGSVASSDDPGSGGSSALGGGAGSAGESWGVGGDPTSGVGGDPTSGLGGSAATTGGSGGTLATGGATSSDPCTLLPDVGTCDAAISAYYFDASLGGCSTFTYGGCGGNANRFATLDECLQACGPSQDCPLTQPSGSCTLDSEIVCLYDYFSACLCQSDIPYSMCILMPECSMSVDGALSGGSALWDYVAAAPADTGSADVAVLIPSSVSCSCANSSWNCSFY